MLNPIGWPHNPDTGWKKRNTGKPEDYTIWSYKAQCMYVCVCMHLNKVQPLFLNFAFFNEETFIQTTINTSFATLISLSNKTCDFFHIVHLIVPRM